ncbi:MAG: GumC family protein [Vicinamibacterales bacterium]
MLPGKTYTFGDLMAALRRRAWWLAVPPVVGLFGALVTSAWLPNIYEAEVLVAIVPQRVPDAFVRSTVALRTEERLDAISVQVLSRALLEQIIREHDLYPAERERMPIEDVVEKMRLDIQVAPERPRPGPRGPEPLHAFRVRFTYPDATLVAEIAQRFGKAFVDQNSRDRDALAVATNDFLETQLVEARGRLEMQEAKLEAFRERYGSALPTQLPTNMQGVQNTQMQIQALVESTARDRDRKLMLARLITELESDPGIAPVPVPAAPATAGVVTAATTTQQLSQARQLLTQLEIKFKPEHPDIIRTRRQIRELEAKVKAEAATGTGDGGVAPAASREELARRERLRDMRAEVESLDRQIEFKESEERRLRAVAAEYQRRIEAVPGVESEWARLSRDYETSKLMYEDLLSKSEQAKVALDLERTQIGEQFRIVDGARVPDKAISPVRLQINGIGLAVGLLVGLALSAWLEFRDASYHTEADVVQALSLPVLTLVPFVETAEEQRVRGRRSAFAMGLAGLTLAAASYLFWSLRLWNYLV